MDKEAWHAAIHGVTKSWTRLSDLTELHLKQLEKEEMKILGLVDGKKF